MDRLRGAARRLPRRLRLRHPAPAQGPEGRARSGRWSSASTGSKAGPTDVVDPRIKSVYNAFGAQLADRGYIVYAPAEPVHRQGPLPAAPAQGATRSRLSLFSFIVRQHERTLDWLATLPHVDPERIAFYGLSYGGKTAMRVPAILKRLLPVDLLGRLQRVGRARTRPRPHRQLHVHRRVRDVRVRPGRTRSTTPRWPA